MPLRLAGFIFLSRMKKILLYSVRGVLGGLALMATANPVFAQIFPGSIVQAMTFGRFAIVNNTSVHSLTINPNNTYTADAAFIINAPLPRTAEVRIETSVYNQPCNVSFNDGYLSKDGALVQPYFTITDLNIADPCMTNPDGSVDIVIGATLKTDASGIHYPSGNYSGGFEMIFQY